MSAAHPPEAIRVAMLHRISSEQVWTIINAINTWEPSELKGLMNPMRMRQLFYYQYAS
jgi:hypothetical protein